MNLKHIEDTVLLNDTKKLAQAEREILVKVLYHLKEIEVRKLFSDLGYSSLFDYCVRELGYSEAPAQRRIAASRLLKEIPEIEKKIESGSLSLMNIASVNHFFRENEVVDTAKKEEVLLKVEGLSKRECDLKLMQLSDKPIEKKHCIWILDSVLQRLKEYRGLKGTHESWDDIILEVTTDAIANLEKTKFKLVDKPRKSNISESRIPTASVKREVFLRDKKCTKCGSTHNLQFDHRQPYSLGGKSTPENIRMLCFNCNQRERIKQRL